MYKIFPFFTVGATEKGKMKLQNPKWKKLGK